MENIRVSTLGDLVRALEKAGVDLSKWGRGGAKTLEHLLKEIAEGETALLLKDGGGIARKTSVVGAEIFHISPAGKRYRLKEDRQIFKDGRERKRGGAMAVMEKMKPGELPAAAMVRGIREELGIGGPVGLKEKDTVEEIRASGSYPGLESRQTLHVFEAVLDRTQFMPEGYIEKQEGLTTYFVWEESS